MEVAAPTEIPDDVRHRTARRRSVLVLSIIKGETSIAEAASTHGLTAIIGCHDRILLPFAVGRRRAAVCGRRVHISSNILQDGRSARMADPMRQELKSTTEEALDESIRH
jgi:hypothetical protein